MKLLRKLSTRKALTVALIGLLCTSNVACIAGLYRTEARAARWQVADEDDFLAAGLLGTVAKTQALKLKLQDAAIKKGHVCI